MPSMTMSFEVRDPAVILLEGDPRRSKPDGVFKVAREFFRRHLR